MLIELKEWIAALVEALVEMFVLINNDIRPK